MLRDLLWIYLYRGEYSEALAWKEIIVALIVALGLLALYWLLIRVFFYTINDNIHNAKIGAGLLAVVLSLSWLIAALDLLGFWSTILGLCLLGLGVIGCLIYLIATRPS